MRHLLILSLILAVGFVLVISAQESAQQPAVQTSTLTTASFKVSGNCGTCKKKIESPFKDMKGVESAIWDKKLKSFTVTFNSSVVSEQKIKEIIAAQGYDTDTVKASDEAYNKLPKCCRYRDVSHE